jgi:hypothetical protein
VLFEEKFTKIADGHFHTALAWGIAALQDSDDPRARAKEQGCSPRPSQDKTCPLPRSGWRSWAEAYWNGLFSGPHLG